MSASEVEVSLLSNHPKRRSNSLSSVGRITVDAREKEFTSPYDALFGG